MPRSCPALLLLAVWAAGGCHRSAAPALDPRAEVAVTVENQNFADMDVFIVRAGQRVRIGMVGNAISEAITIRPGDVIQVTIPPN